VTAEQQAVVKGVIERSLPAKEPRPLETVRIICIGREINTGPC
jgi:hypothetical protein